METKPNKSTKNALIIANGQACSNSLLKNCLKENPYVIVLDAAIERAHKLIESIDVLLGDFDRNFDTEKYQKIFPQLNVISLENQNTTDLDKSLNYLIQQKFINVKILWATGKRADHTITNLTSIVRYADFLNIQLLDDYSRVFPLPKNFEKKYKAQTPLSLIPVGTVQGITTENLKYSLTNDFLQLGFKNGNSNEVLKDGLVKIKYNSGHLLLMECHD